MRRPCATPSGAANPLQRLALRSLRRFFGHLKVDELQGRNRKGTCGSISARSLIVKEHPTRHHLTRTSSQGGRAVFTAFTGLMRFMTFKLPAGLEGRVSPPIASRSGCAECRRRVDRKPTRYLRVSYGWWRDSPHRFSVLAKRVHKHRKNDDRAAKNCPIRRPLAHEKEDPDRVE